MSGSIGLVAGKDGRLIAVGDRVSGEIGTNDRNRRWVEGDVTNIFNGARGEVVVVMNEREEQEPRKRSGLHDRFTKA